MLNKVGVALQNEILLKYSIQYFLVLKPTEHVVEKINEVRYAIYENYKMENFPLSFPYLRLISFNGLNENEIHLINALEKTVRQLSPFHLIFKDFGNFPTHTIYIKAASQVSLKKIVTHIKKEGKLNPLAIELPHYHDEFFIPVAMKIKPWQFEKLSVKLLHSHFSASCIVNEIQLLKREGATGKLKSIANFSLQDITKTVAQQGHLF